MQLQLLHKKIALIKPESNGNSNIYYLTNILSDKPECCLPLLT